MPMQKQLTLRTLPVQLNMVKKASTPEAASTAAVQAPTKKKIVARISKASPAPSTPAAAAKQPDTEVVCSILH